MRRVWGVFGDGRGVTFFSVEWSPCPQGCREAARAQWSTEKSLRSEGRLLFDVFLGGFGAVAVADGLQDDGVMHEAVDRGRSSGRG